MSAGRCLPLIPIETRHIQSGYSLSSAILFDSTVNGEIRKIPLVINASPMGDIRAASTLSCAARKSVLGSSVRLVLTARRSSPAAAFLMGDGQQRVVHAHPNRGIGRRLYGLYVTFTPRWMLGAMHRPLGQKAAMPAAGQHRSLRFAPDTGRMMALRTMLAPSSGASARSGRSCKAAL